MIDSNFETRSTKQRRKLAARGSRPPGYNSIQEERRTWSNAIRQIRVGLSASTVMMETAGEYCISAVEIQYGFHTFKTEQSAYQRTPPTVLVQ
ncbi:MAG: hypothetical protein DME19_05220 [Verrucomicrobia bacterium]|nr:MAG: hypothetical protein DME19_05220 [Verrucomicrobiota bacterium]